MRPVGKPDQRPTLDQVAALAGVGRGTASRVINGAAHVSERSRLAVEAAVSELRYVPNAAARTLKTRRTDTVGLVIAEPADRIFGEPFFAGIVRGISTAASEAGKQLVLMLSQAGSGRAHLENYLTPQHVDGVLLLSLHDDDELPAAIRSRELPMVIGGRSGGDADAPWVDVDNERGARLATQLLVDTGCHVIATITGPFDMTAGRDRYAGFEAALGAAGHTLSDDLVATGDFSRESGATAMTELLARRPDIDGVFCANDPMAAAAMRVLQESGRGVPGDVGVVGFDDSSLALTTHPSLTTVSQHLEDMGRAMVDLLVEQLREPDVDRPRSRLLDVSLIERESTRPRAR